MLERAISRRLFLKVAGAPAAAAAGVSVLACNPLSSESHEHLQSKLENAVNALAIETGRRGQLNRGTEFNSYMLHEDWRYKLLRELFHGNSYPGLNDENIGSTLVKRFEIYNELDAVINTIQQRGHLVISSIELLDRRGDIVGEGYWGKDTLWPDFLKIKASTKDGYGDIFTFRGIRSAKDKGVRVFYDSKQANIKKLQEFYKISEAEAQKRLEEWLPALLNTAKELYVTPASLPSEKWLPSNLPGTPNPLYHKLYEQQRIRQ